MDPESKWTMHRTALIVLMATAAAHAAPLAAPAATPLFVPTPRYPCFRQPAILLCKSTLLAFAENRNVSACAPSSLGSSARRPDEVGSLQLKRSTDGGKSFGPMQSLYVGNIDFYSSVCDATTGMAFLLLHAPVGVAVLSSADGGASWKTGAPLDAEKLAKGDIRVSGPAVGHGIQVDGAMCARGKACAGAGRLLLPFVCANSSASGTHGDKGCTTCNSCLLSSDDAGKSWQLGAVGQQGTRESQVVQVNSTGGGAALYACERNMGAHPGLKQWARSADGGASYTSFGTSTLVAPVTAHWTGIVGGIERLAGGALVYSGPDNPKLRAGMALHVSKDAGASWPASGAKMLWPGPAGYSDMIALPGRESVAVIFECGTKSFADQVSVAIVSKAWLQSSR